MLVSAILPTRGRAELARRALRAIAAQRYRALEIVVLDDADLPSFERFEFHLERPVIYRAIGGLSLGDKLNWACALASGEFLVRFDDDDLYSPGRVADQVDRLLASGKSVTHYRNIRFTDGRRRWLNRNWPGGYGASLAFRRAWWEKHPFPSLSLGEDWEFVAEAMRANEYIAGEAREFLVASIHANNTSPRQIGPGWEELLS